MVRGIYIVVRISNVFSFKSEEHGGIFLTALLKYPLCRGIFGVRPQHQYLLASTECD